MCTSATANHHELFRQCVHFARALFYRVGKGGFCGHSFCFRAVLLWRSTCQQFCGGIVSVVGGVREISGTFSHLECSRTLFRLDLYFSLDPYITYINILPRPLLGDTHTRTEAACR